MGKKAVSEAQWGKLWSVLEHVRTGILTEPWETGAGKQRFSWNNRHENCNASKHNDCFVFCEHLIKAAGWFFFFFSFLKNLDSETFLSHFSPQSLDNLLSSFVEIKCAVVLSLSACVSMFLQSCVCRLSVLTGTAQCPLKYSSFPGNPAYQCENTLTASPLNNSNNFFKLEANQFIYYFFKNVIKIRRRGKSISDIVQLVS